ncbi:hypothetical protein BJX70DRAFT_108038 [Aspergillus crustosus]
MKASPTVQYLPDLTQSGSPIYNELRLCQRERFLGNFQEAVEMLQEMDLSDPEVLLELQLAYLHQGYLNKAFDCRRLVADYEVTLAAAQLSNLDIEPNSAAQLAANDEARCEGYPLTLCMPHWSYCVIRCMLYAGRMGSGSRRGRGGVYEVLQEGASCRDYGREWYLTGKGHIHTSYVYLLSRFPLVRYVLGPNRVDGPQYRPEDISRPRLGVPR